MKLQIFEGAQIIIIIITITMIIIDTSMLNNTLQGFFVI